MGNVYDTGKGDEYGIRSWTIPRYNIAETRSEGAIAIYIYKEDSVVRKGRRTTKLQNTKRYGGCNGNEMGGTGQYGIHKP